MTPNESNLSGASQPGNNLSRRRFVKRALAVGMSLGVGGSLLAACGDATSTASSAGATTAAGGATTAAGGAITAAGTTAAAAGSGGTLKFANWASSESATKDNIDKALALFQTQNNIKIDNIGIPFDQVLQQLTTMTNGGNPPDVIELSGNWPYALGGAGALADLGPFIDSAWKSDAFPNSFEVGTYKGVTYAVPFSITPHGFWYSKDLMTQAGLDTTKPPKTIDDLNQMMTTPPRQTARRFISDWD